MIQHDFFKALVKNFDIGIEILENKNADYAEDGDALKNFSLSELAGVPVARGILVRMFDKMSRISNLLDKDGKVADEKVGDTIIDLMNYANILKVYLDHYRKVDKEEPNIPF